jgi:hypothetical protein
MLAATLATAQTPTVRILFYTGNVTVKSGKGSQKAAIGQQVGPRDEIAIPAGGTLQLSVNGKVVKYAQAMKLKVSDAIKRAGSGENAAVANTVRTLAAASGADRSGRTSQAGATRATDSSRLLVKGKKQVLHDARNAANDELQRRTGIEDPLGKAEQAARYVVGEDDMIILEPRSTSVPSGPVRFRWLRAPSAEGYKVSVKNYLGEEVFSGETKDTTLLWNDPKLPGEVIYTWTLSDTRNGLHNTGALFHRLGDSLDAVVRQGAGDIRRELGDDNPALPLVLGEFYADNGCYGEAANYFTMGALASKQHFNEFMARACDQYQYEMYMPEEEVKVVYGGR